MILASLVDNLIKVALQLHKNLAAISQNQETLNAALEEIFYYLGRFWQNAKSDIIQNML